MTEDDISETDEQHESKQTTLATSPSNYKVQGKLNTTGATGVFGYNEASSGATRGVFGRVDSGDNDAAGVRGVASNGSTFATGDGVVGITEDRGDGQNNEYAAGVRGEATNNSNDQTAGVHGRTNGAGSGARGVNGVADNSNGGKTYGVVGTTFGSGNDAAGVLGTATNGSGRNYGVEGSTASSTTDAAGVKGSSSSGQTYGVKGVTTSSTTGASGVRGRAAASNGTIYGVYGATDSPGGYGLYTPDDACVVGDLDVSGSATVNSLTSNNDISASGSLSAGTHQNITDLGLTASRGGSPKTLSTNQVDVPYDSLDRTDLGQWITSDPQYYYLVPLDGEYHVTATVLLEDEAGSQYTGTFDLYIYLNDTEEAKLLNLTGPSGQVSKTIRAEEDQQIRAKIKVNTTSVKLLNDRAGSFITIDKIG